MNKKVFLKNKLRYMYMPSLGSVTTYLVKITQIRNQLVAIGEKVEVVELINVALNGFTKLWEPFVKGICFREQLLD